MQGTLSDNYEEFQGDGNTEHGGLLNRTLCSRSRASAHEASTAREGRTSVLRGGDKGRDGLPGNISDRMALIKDKNHK